LKKKEKNKIIKIIFGSSVLSIALFMIILIPCLMVLDFFGANITDDYVEDNGEYADQYRTVLEKEIKSGKGYVPLNRILYFYLANEKLTFEKIYEDNLDPDNNKLLEINRVCEINNYKVLEVCGSTQINESNQVVEEQNKPFSKPIDFNLITFTSIFKEQRVVFGKEDVHNAWDLAAQNNTPVYSVCDGTVTKVSFTQFENKTNESAGGGNMIYINCPVDDISYEVWYAHLFPNSNKVKDGDHVTQGEQIAEVGTTGYSTGPHLHFQVRKDNKDVDGMSLIVFSSSTSSPIYNPNDINPVLPRAHNN
jgi:murein DD-endopeptidase MepM/ murein hydrolase activator NlpD